MWLKYEYWEYYKYDKIWILRMLQWNMYIVNVVKYDWNINNENITDITEIWKIIILQMWLKY